jgi:hypothetical protein
MSEMITTWIGRQRRRFAAERELDAIGPAEVSFIARDLGITSPQLRLLVRHWPDVPELLKGMLRALDIDLRQVEVANPPFARDMETLCSICSSKKRCRAELKAGTAARTFREFCPNSSNLEALMDVRTSLAN